MLQRHHHSSSCVGPCSAPGVSSSLLSRPVAPRAPRAAVVLRAGGNGAENGRLTSEKQREIAKILLQTQKNMLELNNSRVKVQEELAMAHRRIADLESELDRMRVEQAREQLKKAEQAATVAATVAPALDQEAAPAPPAAAAPVAAAAAPPTQPLTPSATPQQQQQQQQAPQMPQQQQQQQPQPQPPVTNHHSPPPQQQQQVQQMQQQVQQQQQPMPPQQQQQPMPPQQQQPPAQPAPPALIDLTYISGWHNCFVHYQVDDKPWTSVPGVRLATSKQDHMIKNIIIAGRKMEFVMTNGENDWDSPGRFAEKPKNYVIPGPGTYRLKSGKLEQLS